MHACISLNTAWWARGWRVGYKAGDSNNAWITGLIHCYHFILLLIYCICHNKIIELLGYLGTKPYECFATLLCKLKIERVTAIEAQQRFLLIANVSKTIKKCFGSGCF